LAIINQLTNQFHILADRIENLQYGDALYRVAYRLVFLSNRFGVKEGKKIIIEVPVTHQIIADTINLARETVSRQIEELEKRKLVSHRGRKIVIEDIAKLRRLINKH
jgi:CRP/FNR family transcriptional regulator